jgi:hypothetical protein
MLYFVEAYERFYILCDAAKKKNVTNRSFIAPGLRYGNSAIQYFWLGQPNDSYLERHPMYGPYAYQWKMRRHNRDRHGNGASLSFYSMGWASAYNFLYDAPAVFGLYPKKRIPSSAYVSAVNNLKYKRIQLGISAHDTITYYGEAGEEGTSRNYGAAMYSCNPSNPWYNQAMCEYISDAKSFASSLDTNNYTCTEAQLKAGECFDPCLSLRYSHGMFPGGKLVDLLTANNKLKTRLTYNALHQDEQSLLDRDTFLRGPFATPYNALKNTNGQVVDTSISPCNNAGADHCNYITATIHVGNPYGSDGSSLIKGQTNYFNNIKVGFTAFFN